jgi:hypothetical protein
MPQGVYSPNDVEQKFCELRLYGILRSPFTRTCTAPAQNAWTTSRLSLGPRPAKRYKLLQSAWLMIS